MNLNEMFDQAVPGYQDVQDDNTQLDDDATRKTRLTLKQINKLRRMLDLRNIEYKEKLKKIQKQYAAPAGEAMPPPM
jgi:hypothetical protein